jgi:hypothetical protein
MLPIPGSYPWDGIFYFKGVEIDQFKTIEFDGVAALRQFFCLVCAITAVCIFSL